MTYNCPSGGARWDKTLIAIRADLEQAASRNEAVVIAYQSAGDDSPHAFLLFPRRIFDHGRRAYVEGWSAFQQSRIRSWRIPYQPSGQTRRFRLDRIRNVQARPQPDRSLTGHILAKIVRRGVMPALFGIFLDLLLLAFVIALAVSVFRTLASGLFR